VIISNCVINLSADKDRVLREAFRVLKPGGRLAVSDVVTRGEIDAQIRQNILLWVGCVAGALEEDEYRDKLVSAGFEQWISSRHEFTESRMRASFLSEKGLDVDAMGAASRWQIHERFRAGDKIKVREDDKSVLRSGML